MIIRSALPLRKTCFLLWASLLLTSFVLPLGAQPLPLRDTVVYKTTPQGELTLEVFFPEGAQASDRRPALIHFFGGGWTTGSPSQFYPHCQFYARCGLVAVTAEYRVRSRHQTTPFECVEDGRDAVRWVRRHAALWGVDPERIIASGGSAGGHVAACTATIPNAEDCIPNALVLYNPAVNTVVEEARNNRFGAKADSISPLHHVHEAVPPTLIFHGTHDLTVPYATAQAFVDSMDSRENICQLRSFWGGDHGCFNFREAGPNRYHRYCQREVQAFLFSMGLIDSVIQVDTEPFRVAHWGSLEGVETYVGAQLGADYRVEAVASEEALRAFAPDVLLLDAALPGWETLLPRTQKLIPKPRVLVYATGEAPLSAAVQKALDNVRGIFFSGITGAQDLYRRVKAWE